MAIIEIPALLLKFQQQSTAAPTRKVSENKNLQNFFFLAKSKTRGRS
jgi:hypothetical protein